MSSDSSKLIAAWINGSSGKMGKEIKSAMAKDAHYHLLGGNGRTFEGDPFLLGKTVDQINLGHALKKNPIKLVFDFSNHDGSSLLYGALSTANISDLSILIGSTGLSEELIIKWQQLAAANSVRILIAPNTSIGVLVSAKVAAEAGAALFPKGFDIEIVETHHNKKADAPSGTAKHYAALLLNRLPGLKTVFPRTGSRQENELGMHSIRGGGVFGEHEVRIISANEEVKITHRAFSRSLFSKGALDLGRWLVKQKPGFYRLENVELKDI